MGCRPRSVGTPHRGLWEGSICLHLPPAFISPHLPPYTCTEGELVRLGPSQAFTAPLAPTAPYLFPSLHNMVRLPSLHVLQPQGRVLRLQHSKLMGSKALLTAGKPLMILPTAKIFISLSSPELKQAPAILKPRKVGSNYMTRSPGGQC